MICIRGLKEFKKGCPESSACPLWIETLGSKQPQVIKQCADIAMVNLLWDLNCNMIGNQQAVESFRNNVAESMPVLRMLNGAYTKKDSTPQITRED